MSGSSQHPVQQTRGEAFIELCSEGLFLSWDSHEGHLGFEHVSNNQADSHGS